MNSFSKEQNLSMVESDYVIFSLKNNHNLYKKDNNESFNKSKKQIINNKNNKDNKEENKLPFTNSILKERIKVSNINENIYIRNKGKAQIENKKIENQEEFLRINKLTTINSRQTIKKTKTKNNPKIESIDKKKVLLRNLSISNPEEKKNIYIPNLFEQKISIGQQTIPSNISKTVTSDSQIKNNILNIPRNNNKLKHIVLKKEKEVINDEQIKKFLDNNNSNDNNKFGNSINISKEEKQEEEITDYINYFNPPKFKDNYNNRIFISNYNHKNKPKISNAISLSDLYSLTKNKSYNSKSKHLNHNKSNIMNFSNVKIEEKYNSKSIREIYRNLLLYQKHKEKNKKIKSLLKNKQIFSFPDKKNNKTEKIVEKKANNKLVSLEHLAKNNNKSSGQNLKLKRNKNTTMIKGLKLPTNKQYFGTLDKPAEENENFFTNILKSFSRATYRITKNKMKKQNNKNFLINIQTMIDLNKNKRN